MDNTSIVTLIMLAILTLALIIISRVTQHKKKNKIIKELFDFAKENNCTITDYDYWSNTKIGIDKVTGMLFFIRAIKEKKDSMVVNLKDVLKCETSKAVRTISNGKDKQSVIDKLGLVFISKNKNNTNHYLEFYNTESDNLGLNGELQLLEKWSDLANALIIDYK